MSSDTRITSRTMPGDWPSGSPVAATPPLIRPTIAPVVVDDASSFAFGYYVLLAFLFVYYSGVLDITIPYAKMPLVLGATSALLSVVAGGLRTFTATRIGRCFAILTLLMFVSTPFGVWPGGSASLIKEYWALSMVLFFAIATLSRSLDRCHGVIVTIALARLFAAITSTLTGGMVAGRLVMSSSRFSDPNDLALALLMALPMWVYLRKFARAGWFRLAATPAILLMIVVALRTGSRGGLVGAAVMLAWLLLTLGFGAKLKLVIGLACAIVLSVALLPDSIRARYSTLFSDTKIEEESREGRTHLLKQSIKLTWQNPLLGVGPGMFAVAEDGFARIQGLPRGLWHATHNMYTQVSSEVGIPAAVAFCAGLAFAYRTFRRIQREATAAKNAAVESMTYWLTAALVGFCAAGFFLSVAYEGHVPALLGLATALDSAWAKARAKAGGNRHEAAASAGPSLMRPTPLLVRGPLANS